MEKRQKYTSKKHHTALPPSSIDSTPPIQFLQDFLFVSYAAKSRIQIISRSCYFKKIHSMPSSSIPLHSPLEPTFKLDLLTAFQQYYSDLPKPPFSTTSSNHTHNINSNHSNRSSPEQNKEGSWVLLAYCQANMPASCGIGVDWGTRAQLNRRIAINTGFYHEFLQFFRRMHQTSPLSVTSTLQHSKTRKKCLVPCKSIPNSLFLNISQLKVLTKDHTKKPQTPLKESKTHTSTLKKSSTVENKQTDTGDQENFQIPLKQEFNVKSIQQYIFSPVGKEERKKYVHNLYLGAIYSLQKLKSIPQKQVLQKSIYLSQATQSNKKFLLLDLDQTLISTKKDGKTTSDSNKVTYKFLYRPHLFTFLERMSTHYEIYVFTAAHKSYAEAVVNKLNKFKVYIRDVLYRDHCFQTKKGVFIKDLRIIKNRGLEDLVLVDNLVESFGSQLDNGVPLLEYNGNPHDEQLLKIIPFLEQLSQAEDVRTILQEKFRLSEVSQLDRKSVRNYFSEE